LQREENRITQRKALKARERINNKLNSHMTAGPGIEPEIKVVRGERLAATPPMHPVHRHFGVFIKVILDVTNVKTIQ
jgi:hypothetical protein